MILFDSAYYFRNQTTLSDLKWIFKVNVKLKIYSVMDLRSFNTITFQYIVYTIKIIYTVMFVLINFVK